MLTKLEDLFEGGCHDFETAAAMAGIKTEEGVKIARIFWSILQHIKQMEGGASQ